MTVVSLAPPSPETPVRAQTSASTNNPDRIFDDAAVDDALGVLSEVHVSSPPPSERAATSVDKAEPSPAPAARPAPATRPTPAARPAPAARPEQAARPAPVSRPTPAVRPTPAAGSPVSPTAPARSTPPGGYSVSPTAPARPTPAAGYAPPTRPTPAAGYAPPTRSTPARPTPAVSPTPPPSYPPQDSYEPVDIDGPAHQNTVLESYALPESFAPPVPTDLAPPVPSAPYPSAPYPSAPYPSAQYPSAPYPSAPYPSAQHPSAPYPSAQHPSAPYPSAPYPSAPYPSAQAPALPAAPRSGRGLKLALGGVALAAVVGGGLAIGWGIFARGDHDAAPETSKPAPPQVPVAARPPVTPVVKPAVTPGEHVATPGSNTDNDPKHTTATAEIISLEHPILEKVVSPSHGQVALVAVSPSGQVKMGDNLFTIRHKQTGGAKGAALVKRIAELQGLAKEDPAAYEPFLARARRDLDQLQQVSVVAVKASTTGLAESRVKVGDQVEDGAVLGALLDGRTWLAVAIFKDSEPTATWSCAVATPDDTHTAACKIQTTEAIKGDGGGTRVTVEIATTGTAWLDGLDQHPRLVLDPPAR